MDKPITAADDLSGGFDPADHPRAFRNALGRFATGVAVVTAAGPDGPMGFTVNSFAAVSLDPPLVLWSPAKSSSRFAVFAAAKHYAIHVLAAEQADWLGRFARGGAGFEGLPFHLSPDGVPLIDETLARFECAQETTFDGGDHLIILGRVIEARYRKGAPLLFSQGEYGGFVAG